MKIAVLKERRPNETRVAASPETVGKMVAMGLDVVVESGAGEASSFSDDAYKKAGASIGKDAKAAAAGADVVIKIQRPMIASEGQNEMAVLAKGQGLVSLMNALTEPKFVGAMAAAGVTGFALELIPRITRAQSMDVLSSQSNLAGYRAVLDGAAAFGRAFPMMMTAAGTIPPARALVMGAGVAGLQAIATARRLGAVVSATDVRPAAKEQVESLGGTFVAVEDEEFKQAETAGGYAKEMSAEYQKKQAALIAETIKKQDMVITTALIPGRPAPKLISADMVKTMKPGAVIVDLAVEQGGNCELSEYNSIVQKHGVTIVGHANVPGRLAESASNLFARNILSFLTLLVDEETKAMKIDPEDEIIAGTLVTRDGKVVHKDVKAEIPAPAKAASAGAKKGAGAKKPAGAAKRKAKKE
ncbi:MAG: Re/Si-specific NAD(P)(+) transhydrogenase subunit alpha [Alphaproteobacteria bacterium]|nr:Re/Si-specific NAD(P)(+) transhydrogenase subunit alpha [Alphaproteobacteria bacterium]